MNYLPKHVAFIMDGNRRWAREHKLSLFFGHENGAKRIEPLVEFAITKDISHLTFWAFSTENWGRPDDEVKDLLDVFRKALRDPMMQRLHELNVKITIIGELAPFPDDIKADVARIINETKDNTRIMVTFALNYGGRAEILSAVQKIIAEKKETISESEFSELLYSAGMPDPELVIRTGGDMRLSGYLPWQSVYAELYFTETYWPDFNEDAFEKALGEFTNRQRRFGK